MEVNPLALVGKFALIALSVMVLAFTCLMLYTASVAQHLPDLMGAGIPGIMSAVLWVGTLVLLKGWK